MTHTNRLTPMTRRSQANEEEEDDFAPMEGQDDQDEEGGEEEEESNNEDPQNSQDPQMQGKDKRSILRTEMRKMIQRGQSVYKKILRSFH